MHYSFDATTVAPSSSARTALVRLALLVSLFFPWGMANNLNDILTTQSKSAFERSDFQVGLVQRAFYLGFSVRHSRRHVQAALRL